jgi:hypothetical protein
LNVAIDEEMANARVTIHPFYTLLSGAAKFVGLGGILSHDQAAKLLRRKIEAKVRFGSDAMIDEALQRLEVVL